MTPSKRSRKTLASAVAALALVACAAVAASAGADVKRLPDVVTGKTGRAVGGTVLLTGSVNPEGSPTTYYFQFGPTTAYGLHTKTGNAGNGIKPIKVGLSAAPIVFGYHYRLVATNQFGTRVGKDRVYTSKATKLKFEVTAPAAPWGSASVVSGRLLGASAAHHRIALLATPFPYKEAFEEIGAPTVTNAAGRFSFRLGVLHTSWLLRVMTLDPLPKFSKPFKAVVTLRVTFSVRTSSKFGFVRLYGKVTPAQVGAKVTFQYLKSIRPGVTERKENRTTKFVTAGTTTVKRATKKFSFYSLIVDVRHGGLYHAIVTPRSGGLASGVSRNLVVRGPAKKRKHP
jgi:hypothetical protein